MRFSMNGVFLEACEERGVLLDDSENDDVYSNLKSPNSQGRYLVGRPHSVSLLDGDHTPIVSLDFEGGRITYVSRKGLPEWFDLVVGVPGVGLAETKAIEQIVRLYAFDTQEVQDVLGRFEQGQFVRTRVPDDYGRIVSVKGPVLRVMYPESWISPVTFQPIQETDFDMTRRIWQEFVSPVSEEDVPEADKLKLKQL